MSKERVGMKRRRFLQTTVLAAGGVSLLGCDDDGGGGDDASALDGRTIVDGAKYFPQSVASGDPRAESVILWTRVEDGKAGEEDLPLVLQVALDDAFTMLVELADDGKLTAQAAHDGCVRARVDGLEANTTYYYRFAYLLGDDEALVSRTGRTKTAPDAKADVPVKFAVASCQDFIGRYFHSYKHMAEQELDFFVHLGDYVYETTGDPSFQDPTGKRKIEFSDTEGALALGEDMETFYAASALDNYRELYKTYRSDPDLQRVHELFPMIAVWDDHEFSDDCHGQTATYLDGTMDERSPTRRTHADQAWFEFMPVDYAEPDFEYDPKAADFPEDLTIYRDFTFGKHVHLVMTDLRRYRDDHLVPEDAFPGAVAATEAELVAAFGDVPEYATAYVDLDDAAYAEHKALLNDNAEALGFVEGDFAGLVGVDFVNEALDDVDAATKPAPIDGTAAKRGIVFAQLFKRERFSNVGSRYVVVSEPYDAYAKTLWVKSKGKAQQVFGDAQEKWFVDTIKGSKQTWKIWGNEYTLMRRYVDLREQAAAGAIGLQTLLYLSAEDWDGMPDRRAKILDAIGGVSNVVAVTGDIHAFFTGIAQSDENPKNAIIEFVAGAISSGTYKDMILSVAEGINPAAVALADAAEVLLRAANPHMAHASLDTNGYGLFTATAEALNVTYYELPGTDVLKPELTGKIDDAFEAKQFEVPAGKKQILRDNEGKTERWDPQMGDWVAA